METLILIASVLGSAAGGLFGLCLSLKHSRKLLTPDATLIDFFFGNPVIGSLLIVLFGAGGFWLPNTLCTELFLAEKAPVERSTESDRKPQSTSSFSIGE